MGYIYALGSAITWGLVYAIDQKILGKVSPSVLMLINSVFSIIILLPILLVHTEEIKTLTTLNNSDLKLIAVTLIFTLLANMLIYLAIQHLGSSKAAIFEVIYPFFVVIFSIAMYKTQVNGYFIVGSVLIFIGSAIIITQG